MSLVERYAANFIPNRVTFRERSAFRGLFIRKICAIACSSCVITKIPYFTFFITEKNKNAVQARKILREVYEESVLTLSVLKSGVQNFDVKDTPRFWKTN